MTRVSSPDPWRRCPLPGRRRADRDTPRRTGLILGSPMSVVFAKTGNTRLRVAAIFSDDTFGSFFVSLTQYRLDFTAQEDQVILVAARPGMAASAAKLVATRALRDYPNLDVRTKAEYKAFIVGRIKTLLRLFYALLAMAVVIAIFGIVLTLALSVFERARARSGFFSPSSLSPKRHRTMIR